MEGPFMSLIATSLQFLRLVIFVGSHCSRGAAYPVLLPFDWSVFTAVVQQLPRSCFGSYSEDAKRMTM